MSLFQILAVLFALFMLYVVNIHKSRSLLSVLEVYFWYVTWGTFIIISLFPDLLKDIAGVLHFSRVFDLLTVVALMIVTFLVLSNYFVQKENHKKLEDMVRRQALKRT